MRWKIGSRPITCPAVTGALVTFIAYAGVLRAQTPPSSAPATAASTEPTIETVIQDLARLDPAVLAQRLADAQSRTKALSDATAPMKAKVAANDAELPMLTLKVALLDALVKARGAGPAPPPAPTPGADPTVDGAMEAIAKIEPGLLAAQLPPMQARLKALTGESADMKTRIAANEAELAKLAPTIHVLEALAKARSQLSAPPPAQATFAPAPAPAMAPPATMPAANAAPAAPPPAVPPGTPSSAMQMSAAAPPPSSPAPPPVVNYAEHVFPIFAEKCLGCHNPDKSKGGLLLDTYMGVMTGGSSGQVIVPGQPDASRLLRLVSHIEEPHMPPLSPKLDDAKLDVIRRWIQSGAIADSQRGQTDLPPVAQASPVQPVSAEAPADAREPNAAPIPVGLAKNTGRPITNAPPAIALATSPAADLLAVAAEDRVLYIDGNTGELLGVLENPDGRIERLCFSADGAALLVAGGRAGQTGTVSLFDVETGRQTARIDRQYDAVLTAAISPDGGLVAVGGTNRKVRVFDAYAGSRLFEIAQHNDWVLDVAFSPDGMLLASADRAGGLFIWESDTGRHVHSLQGHTGAVTGVAFRADSQALASCGADGTIRIWDMESGGQVASWGAHAGMATCVEFLADGRLVSAGIDGSAKLWQAGGQQVRAFDHHGDWVHSLALPRDGKSLVTGCWSGAVTAFDLESGAVRRKLSTAIGNG